MGFAKIRDIVDYGEIGGQINYSSFIKVPATTGFQGVSHDLAISPGNPKQIYYDGPALTASLFDSNKGIWTGGNVSPAKKHLSKVLMVSASASVAPCAFWICDFLLCYPLIDFTVPFEQYFDNTITLPRYTDGLGVKAFLVSTSIYVGGQNFYIEYVDSDGIVKYSTNQQMNAANVSGSIINSGYANANFASPFIQVYSGGIRSIRHFKMVTAVASGQAALVLCKPLAMVMVRELTAAAEKDFVLDAPSMPVILDGAHLQMIGAPNGNWTGVPILGEITTVWR